MAEERVQKLLARAGYGSRRASEELISAGRVRINGMMAELGSKADPQRDTITVDNQPIARAQPPVYIALNKPRGILSEVSPEEERETVRDLVSIPGHMFIVGRLDMESEGLILLTNDGELANRLTHPRYGHEKEYRVMVGTRPDEEQMQNWRRGIVLEDGYRTAPAEVRLEGIAGKNAWLRVILREGRKRQIREMGRLTGLPVLRIVRIRIGSLVLGELKPGEWRQLRPDELRALRTPAVRSPQARVTRRPGMAGGRPSAGRPTGERRGSGAGRDERSGGENRPGRDAGRPTRSPRDGFKKAEETPLRSGPPRSGPPRRSGPSSAEDRSDFTYSRQQPSDRRSTSGRPAAGRAASGRPAADRTGFADRSGNGDRPDGGARPRPARPSTGKRPSGSRPTADQRPDYSDRGKPSRPTASRRPSGSRGADDRPSYPDRAGAGDRPAADDRSRPARRPARPEGGPPRRSGSRPSSGQRPGGSGSRTPGGKRRVNRNRPS